MGDSLVKICGGIQNYSLDEQVVGTWIDGKPLYQRIFNTTSLQSDDNWHTIATIPSVSFSMIKDIICISSSGDSGIDTSFSGANQMQVLITSSGELRYALKYDVSEVYIIVQYTKTTD